MDPILFRNFLGINGVNIHWYGVIICGAIVAGIFIGKRLAKIRGYIFDVIIDMMIIVLPLAIIGARLYYVAFEWSRYAANPISIIYIWEGGLGIYGAVIGAVVGVYVFCKWKKISFGELLDIGAPALILGQAIGRWGNFMNQEAFGAAVTEKSAQWFPLSVEITHAHQVFDEVSKSWIVCSEPWHQATFFYESMWNLLVFGALLFYFKKAKHKGNVFVMYLILYGLGRVIIEGMRTDSLWLIPGVIRVSQLISGILFIGGIIYLLIMRKKEPKIAEYSGKYSLNYNKGVIISEETDTEKTDTPE